MVGIYEEKLDPLPVFRMRAQEVPRMDADMNQDGDRRRRWVSVPVSYGNFLSMEFIAPMTAAEWEQMMTVLQAIRPGIVAEDAPPQLQETQRPPDEQAVSVTAAEAHRGGDCIVSQAREAQ